MKIGLSFHHVPFRSSCKVYFMIDQRRFNNQRSDSDAKQWIDSRAAAGYLGVSIRTLYAYVSRGAVRSMAATSGRSRLYLQQDLTKLKVRHDARAGHGAVAAAALRWGEPVMDSAITEITSQGPAYRGHLATRLARRGISFERTAELLWQGHLPADDVDWPRQIPPNLETALAASANGNVIDVMAMITTAMACSDPDRSDTRPDALLRVARRLLPLLAATSGRARNATTIMRLLRAPSIADMVGKALGANHDQVSLINHTLVVLADHELNASSFAARIAASADADGYAIVNAGLAVLSGTGHGAHSLRVEAMLTTIGSPVNASSFVQRQRARGLALPGFGHTLYPDGDPRGVEILATALRLGARLPRIKVIAAVLDATRAWSKPNIDFALAALCACYDLPPGSGVALFAIGRTAGWFAHAIEQRAAGFLLRPRARYVGSRFDGSHRT
jgi:citrate synthase